MNIAIIGLGLIGGSLARTLVKKTKHIVYAHDSNQASMVKGNLMKAYHHVLTEDAYAVIDVVILALPPQCVTTVIKNITPKLKNGCIVIDCVGTKRNIVNAMRELAVNYPDICFIGGHPMAGREYSGISHSSVNLYDNASMIFVPVTQDLAKLSIAKALFMEIGFGRVVISTAEEHDRIISFTSQLAHIISSSYVLNPTAKSHFGFSAGSFRDMTRVARLDADMWTQLFTENADNLIHELNDLINNLQEYKSLLEHGDKQALRGKLAEGNDVKINIDKINNNSTAKTEVQ